MSRVSKPHAAAPESALQLQNLVEVIVNQQILPSQLVCDIAQPRRLVWSNNSCWFHTFIQCMASYNLDTYKFTGNENKRKREDEATEEIMSDFASGTSYEKGNFYSLSSLFCHEHMYNKIAEVVGPFGALKDKYHPSVTNLDGITDVVRCFWLDVEVVEYDKYIRKFEKLLETIDEKNMICLSTTKQMRETIAEAKLNARIKKINEQITIVKNKFYCEPRALYVFTGGCHFFARVKWYTGQCFLCDDLNNKVEKIDSLFHGVDFLNINAILFVKTTSD